MTLAAHDWLRRLSDYHSGDVDDAERAAVEDHLASCAECREALAQYHRFYALARSPLRLGPPSALAVRRSPRFSIGSTGITESRLLPRRSGTPPQVPQSRRRRTLLAVAAVLAASLVVTGFVAALSMHLRPIEGQPTPTPTSSKHVTPTPVATVTPTPVPTLSVAKLPPPGSGYTNSGPAWAQAVAIAPSAPTTVYSCGNTAPKPSGGIQGPGAIAVGVSRDGGHAWQTYTTGAIATACQLSVNPTNAQDSVMLTLTTVCSGDACQSTGTHLYRSRNGGAGWTLASAPGGAVWDFDAAPAWLGSTLFVLMDGGLARSHDGGAFSFVATATFETDPTISPASSVTTVGLFTANDQLLIEIVACDILISGAPPGCIYDYAESDASAHSWITLRMQYQPQDGQPQEIEVVASGADGHSLLGLPVQPEPLEPPPPRTTQPLHPVLISTDGGATWSVLPPYPGPLLCCDYFRNNVVGSGLYQHALGVAPDGSVILSLYVQGGEGAGGVFLLARGASSWTYAAAPAAFGLLAFQWTSTGHLAALWGAADAGLQFRAL